MSTIWRIPSGPDGTLVQTNRFEDVQAFLKNIEPKKPTASPKRQGVVEKSGKGKGVVVPSMLDPALP